MLDTILEILKTHEEIFWWLGLGSIGLLVGTALLIPWLITVIPADFFARKLDESAKHSEPRRAGAVMLALFRNLLGIVLFIAGFIMLFVPGQGLLTILIAVALIDFPGKNALLRKLVNSPRIFNAANGIRRWAGKPAFLHADALSGASDPPRTPDPRTGRPMRRD